MASDLLRYRSEFPILESTTYLISNSLGAMPRGVETSLQHYAEMWKTITEQILQELETSRAAAPRQAAQGPA
jgi:kynureninase